MVSRYVPRNKPFKLPPPRRAPSQSPKQEQNKDPNANLPLPDLYRRDLSEYSRQGNKLIDYAGNNDKYRYEYTLDDKGRIKSYQAFRKNDGQYRLDDRYLFSYDGDQVASYVREDYDRGGLDYRRTYDLKDFTVQSYDPIGPNEVVYRDGKVIADTTPKRSKRSRSGQVKNQVARVKSLKEGSFAREQAEFELARMLGQNVKRFDVYNPYRRREENITQGRIGVRDTQANISRPLNAEEQVRYVSTGKVNEQKNFTPQSAQDFRNFVKTYPNLSGYSSVEGEYRTQITPPVSNMTLRDINRNEKLTTKEFAKQAGKAALDVAMAPARGFLKFDEYIASQLDIIPFLERPEYAKDFNYRTYNDPRLKAPKTASGLLSDADVQAAGFLTAGFGVAGVAPTLARTGYQALTGYQAVQTVRNPTPRNVGTLGVYVLGDIGARGLAAISATNPKLANLPNNARFSSFTSGEIIKGRPKLDVLTQPTGRVNVRNSVLEKAPPEEIYQFFGKNYQSVGVKTPKGYFEIIQTRSPLRKRVNIERSIIDGTESLVFRNRKGDFLASFQQKAKPSATTYKDLGLDSFTGKEFIVEGFGSARYMRPTEVLNRGSVRQRNRVIDFVTRTRGAQSSRSEVIIPQLEVTPTSKSITIPRVKYGDSNLVPMDDIVKPDRLLRQADILTETQPRIYEMTTAGRIRKLSLKERLPSIEAEFKGFRNAMRGKRAQSSLTPELPFEITIRRSPAFENTIRSDFSPNLPRFRGKVSPRAFLGLGSDNLLNTDIFSSNRPAFRTEFNTFLDLDSSLVSVQSPDIGFRNVQAPINVQRAQVDLREVTDTLFEPDFKITPRQSLTPSLGVPFLPPFSAPPPPSFPKLPSVRGSDEFLRKERRKAKRARKAGFSPDIISAIEKEIKDTQRTSGTFTGLERRYLPKEFREILG